MILIMIFEAKVTMPPREIEMKPHQVLLKMLMTVVVLLMVVMLMNKVHHLVSNLQCLTYPCMTGDYLECRPSTWLITGYPCISCREP